MTPETSNYIDESTLTKGQVRKLNALRKSVGNAIGERAFADWMSSQRDAKNQATDKNAEVIAAALWSLVAQNRLSIRRGGYLVKRGRGRVVVEAAAPSVSLDDLG